MASRKSVSPFFTGTFSSNGDSSSGEEEEDDDVFINSRLDVISRACDDMDDDGLEYYENPNSSCLLNFKKNANSESSLFTPSPKAEDNAVIFSVYLYGKYYGDVGLFEPDISVLDWREFKLYINLLDSESSYEDLLKIAKAKVRIDEKLPLCITRSGGGLTSSIKSLVSSSLRRVNSVGGSKSSITMPPAKKDVTTSTSFHNIGNIHSKTADNEEMPSSFVASPQEELNSPQENYYGENYQQYSHGCEKHCLANESLLLSYSSSNPLINNSNCQNTENSTEAPTWFISYMKQFKEDLFLEVSSKIEERFDAAVGNLSATDVETKLRGLLTGYSTELQNKVLCCCKDSNDHCEKSTLVSQSPAINVCRQETSERQLVTPLTTLKMDQREDSLESEGGVFNNQDDDLLKLLSRELQVLDFVDNTNEKIKQKIKDNNDYKDSLRDCLAQESGFEDRERVLARLEDFRQRQTRTRNDIRMLQQSMEGKNESITILSLQDLRPEKEYDAKFIKDLTYEDESKVKPGEDFTKHWIVQNTGLRPWNTGTFLVCQPYHLLRPTRQMLLCPRLLPGEVGVIAVDFEAPLIPGIYSTEWRFMQCDVLFGNHLWCSVIVTSTSESIEDVKAPSLPIVESHAHLFQEVARNVARNPDFTSPFDFIPFKFDRSSIEYFSYINKESLTKLSSEETLYYLLYIVRIAQPDFATLPDRLPLDFLCKCLSRGNDGDFDNLSLFLDKHFIENCLKDSFKIEEMIQCYKELFLTTKDHDNQDYLIKQFHNRITNDSNNYIVYPCEAEEKEEWVNEGLKKQEENVINAEVLEQCEEKEGREYQHDDDVEDVQEIRVKEEEVRIKEKEEEVRIREKEEEVRIREKEEKIRIREKEEEDGDSESEEEDGDSESEEEDGDSESEEEDGDNKIEDEVRIREKEEEARIRKTEEEERNREKEEEDGNSESEEEDGDSESEEEDGDSDSEEEIIIREKEEEVRIREKEEEASIRGKEEEARIREKEEEARIREKEEEARIREKEGEARNREKEDEVRNREKEEEYGDSESEEEDGDSESEEEDGDSESEEEDGDSESEEEDGDSESEEELIIREKEEEARNREKEEEARIREKEEEARIREKEQEVRNREKKEEVRNREEDGDSDSEEEDGDSDSEDEDGDSESEEEDGDSESEDELIIIEKVEELRIREKEEDVKIREKEEEVRIREKEEDVRIRDKEEDGDSDSEEEDGDSDSEEEDGDSESEEEDGDSESEDELIIIEKVEELRIREKEEDVKIREKEEEVRIRKKEEDVRIREKEEEVRIREKEEEARIREKEEEDGDSESEDEDGYSESEDEDGDSESEDEDGDSESEEEDGDIEKEEEVRNREKEEEVRNREKEEEDGYSESEEEDGDSASEEEDGDSASDEEDGDSVGEEEEGDCENEEEEGEVVNVEDCREYDEVDKEEKEQNEDKDAGESKVYEGKGGLEKEETPEGRESSYTNGRETAPLIDDNIEEVSLSMQSNAVVVPNLNKFCRLKENDCDEDDSNSSSGSEYSDSGSFDESDEEDYDSHGDDVVHKDVKAVCNIVYNHHYEKDEKDNKNEDEKHVNEGGRVANKDLSLNNDDRAIKKNLNNISEKKNQNEICNYNESKKEKNLTKIERTKDVEGATAEPIIDFVTKKIESSLEEKKSEELFCQEVNLKKNITTLRENFKQNVEVNLDFEVLQNKPKQEETCSSTNGLGLDESLTFQETHFTISTRLPLDPVPVPDSDDESENSIVFIKDCNVPSSGPTPGPCSPLDFLPQPLIKHSFLSDSQLSLSASSYSEIDDEDVEAAATEIISQPQNETIHDCESSTPHSPTSESAAADDDPPSSVCCESSLADDDCQENFYSFLSDNKREEECAAKRPKSPEANGDSGSSTSHTLKDFPPSESSGSYDVNEAPGVDIAPEESTSEFEYVVNVGK